MKYILIVGGGGYIGSYICKHLYKNGYKPIVLDNLIFGHREAIKWGPFFKGSMSNRNLIKLILSEYDIMAVMHFAAYCYVGESVREPIKYYINNVVNTVNLLRVMLENKISKFVFSSSCAIYGEPVKIPITEQHPQNPINPYGRSKLMVEQILNDLVESNGLKFVSLRYFNAAGADTDTEIGEDHRPETHLIPLVLQTALDKREFVNIFGDNYPTDDGTCIRDYIHIIDLAQAHLLALERILDDKFAQKVYNLGNGTGYSVKQVIDTARKITKKNIKTRTIERRIGDPSVLIASNELACKELGWKPQYSDIETIIETAWEWHKKNPYGFKY